MLSIDQNCHSLWDVVPKLHALAAAGHGVTHFIEDIDSAFTELGADVADGGLRLARERFHRSGGADWGAALFYTEFLGRLPVEVRRWEPLTGMKTKELARKLGRSVDDLYDEFSPGDNWQLIGSSFVGDRRHHRVIGDLKVSETAGCLREMLEIARGDMLGAFPAAASRRRLAAWLDREQALVDSLLAELADAPLVRLYDRWMREHIPGSVPLDMTSRLFACAASGAPGLRLLPEFLADYDRVAALYDEAVVAADVGLRPLATREGELPFFATFEHEGRLVRTALHWRDGALHAADRAVPLPGGGADLGAALAGAGIRCVAGKAAVLVTQVRMGPAGEPLALPHRGSLYMPAAHAFARNLAAAGLLPGELRPVVRVRLRLLDRLRSLDTPIRLPGHLAEAMGAEEVPARALGEAHADLVADAAGRLAAFRDEATRDRWQRESFPEAAAEIDALDRRRRELAARDPKAPELRDIWKRLRALQTDRLAALVRRIDLDTQVAELGYYDSRGAVLPWCVALGGETFYNEVVRNAEITEEYSLRA